MKIKIVFYLFPFLLFSCGRPTIESKPEFRDITETVFASGTLEPNNKYNLTAQTDGYLTELRFTEGDLVKEGDVLAIIDNKQNVVNTIASNQLLTIAQVNAGDNAPALMQTEANIALAAEKLKQDELQASRYKTLYESNSVSKLEYENILLALKNSKTNLTALEQSYKLQKQQAEQQLINQQAQKNVNEVFSKNNELKAVVGGKVYKKNKETGDYIRRGDVLAVIGNATDLYARLNVDESNISKIKTGLKVAIQLNTNKTKTEEGIVTEILPSFDELTQSFICKVKFIYEPAQKIAGTQLQANIIVGTKKNVMVIPKQFLGYGNKVRVKDKKEPVTIKTGFVSSEWVEVLDGISKEDVLVTDKLN